MGWTHALPVTIMGDATPDSMTTLEAEDAGLRGRRVVHADCPIVASPSGLPVRHLISEREGASQLFLGQQWLQPGERVKRHTHPVEEILTFVAGAGEAMIEDRIVAIGASTSLHIPAGVVHGFSCTGPDPLHVLIIFPTASFAPTSMTTEESTSTW